MDAEYYFAGGVRLAEGRGFSELILWNYLDDPSGLPHPSHGYWMPLASLMAALGMVFSNEISFSTAKSGFLIVAGLLPPVTAALAFSINASKAKAIFSGLLAAFPVYYLAYLGTTDTFAIYMLLGGIWFLILGALIKKAQLRRLSRATCMFLFLGLGLISGLMHLARADGILWLLLGAGSIVLVDLSQKKPCGFVRRLFVPLSVFILGYLLVMGPWMVRNISAFGTPLAPGGVRMLWLTEYDDIYSYPASSLTFHRWWSNGIANILSSRAFALWQNLQTFLVVQGGIILSPFILLGMWRLRKDMRVQIGFIGWLATFLIMTFIFTEVGWRGGFFHSGAALQPFIWAMVPVGFGVFLDWGVRVRGWRLERAKNGFGIILFNIVGILTVFITWQRVIGLDIRDPVWNQSHIRYTLIEEELFDRGAMLEDIVLVNNAPGYFVATGRGALSIPNGDENTLLEVARHYSARYILLDENYPRGLIDLYQYPGDRTGLTYLGKAGTTNIYLVGE